MKIWADCVTLANFLSNMERRSSVRGKMRRILLCRGKHVYHEERVRKMADENTDPSRAWLFQYG